MKVLVTGVTGQLGFDVMRVLRGRGANAVGATRSEMPLNDPARARAFVLETRPDAVIHCGAYTAVDRAEDEQPLCHICGKGYIKRGVEQLDADLQEYRGEQRSCGAGSALMDQPDRVRRIVEHDGTCVSGIYRQGQVAVLITFERTPQQILTRFLLGL